MQGGCHWRVIGASTLFLLLKGRVQQGGVQLLSIIGPGVISNSYGPFVGKACPGAGMRLFHWHFIVASPSCPRPPMPGAVFAPVVPQHFPPPASSGGHGRK